MSRLSILAFIFILGCSNKSESLKVQPKPPPFVPPPQEVDLTQVRCGELDLWVISKGELTFEEKLYSDGTTNRSVLKGLPIDEVLKAFSECESFFLKKYEFEQDQRKGD